MRTKRFPPLRIREEGTSGRYQHPAFLQQLRGEAVGVRMLVVEATEAEAATLDRSEGDAQMRERGRQLVTVGLQSRASAGRIPTCPSAIWSGATVPGPRIRRRRTRGTARPSLIVTALMAHADAEEDLALAAMPVDSPIVRAHRHAAGARKKGSRRASRPTTPSAGSRGGPITKIHPEPAQEPRQGMRIRPVPARRRW